MVNFELVEEASKQRRTKLIDSRGYTYNVKRRTQSATVWQCSVRTKSTYCKATVKQIEDEFIITQSHNHQPAVGAVTAAKLVDEVPVNPLTRKLICFHGQIIVIPYVKTCAQTVEMSEICFSKTEHPRGADQLRLVPLDMICGLEQ